MSKGYGAYLFRTKDPEIDNLKTIAEDYFGQRLTRKNLRQIEKDGGPSTSAMVGWFFGGTRMPRSAGIEACGRAMRYKRTWTKMNGKG